jgi:hypothetical protein
VKTKQKGSKATGANADGGTIEKGQSRSTHAKADASSTGKTGEAEWLDETERDTPDRKKISDELTNGTTKSRKAGKQ